MIVIFFIMAKGFVQLHQLRIVTYSIILISKQRRKRST